MNNELFKKLYSTDCSKWIERKKTGNTELSYLSWAYAWAMLRQNCPDASYEVVSFDGLPYICDSVTGIMVFTRVTAGGETHEMWLPVMDASNKAMKLEPYAYKVYDSYKKQYVEKYVAAATMFDINKTIMRCLVKNIAMFGLGLSLYAGEDIPVPLTQEEEGAIREEIKAKETKQKTHIDASNEDMINRVVAWAFNQEDIPAAIEKARKGYDWGKGAFELFTRKIG